MDNDRDDLTFTTLGGAAGGAGQQTFIVEHQVGFLTIMNFQISDVTDKEFENLLTAIITYVSI